MSKDKKNKATKKRRKWLDILRWVLIVVLLVVGLALIFNKSIRNTVIAWNTNKYQVSKVSKKTIEKNKEAKTSFKNFLSLVVLPFQRWVSIFLFSKDLAIQS